MTVTRKHKLRPKVSIYCDRYVIHIGRDVIRALQYPEHICLKVTGNCDSIAVMPSESGEILSFQVPEKFFLRHTCLMRIRSKQFVCMVLEKNKLPVSGTYMLNGTYSASENACIFRFSSNAENGTMNVLHREGL